MGTTVKTALCIEKTLFDRAEKIAKKLHMSRSSLYAQSMEYYLTGDENLTIIKEINAAYGDSHDTKKKVTATRKRRTRKANQD